MTNVVDIAPVLLDTCGIIRQSRGGWTDVAAAMDRLAGLATTNDPYNEMESDHDQVLEYADTVRRSGDLIGYAICLATHLTKFVPPATAFEQRFTDGLRALSDGLGLRQRDETDTRAELARCMRALLPNRPLPFDPWGADREIDAAWTTQLQELITEVHLLPPPPEIQSRAWETWQSRLLAMIQGTSEIPTDLDHLRCRAEGSNPGTILGTNLKSLLLSEWGNAYAKTMNVASSQPESYCPLWFAYGVLAALGFEAGSELTRLATVAANHNRKDAEATIQFLQRVGHTSTSRKGTIVIRAKAGSLTSTWTPSRSVPTLCLTMEEFSGQTRVDLQPYFSSRLHGILLEVEPNDAPAEVQRRVAELLKRPQLGSVVLLTRTSRNDLGTFKTVVAPSDLISACTQAFGLST